MSNSLVARVNPSFKLFLHLICMTMMVFIDDWRVSLSFMIIPFVVSFGVARIPLKTFFWRFLPFVILFFTTTWTFAAFGRGETVWWEWAWFHISEEGLYTGLNVGFRMMGFVAYGLLFSFTTDLTLLSISLIQQCKVSPKFAYALLAGFRFMPMFRDEYEQIKAAHRVRGVGRVPGLRGKWQRFVRYTIPLLAQGIRKAERMAVALEARGFDGSRNRTYYRNLRIGGVDALYLLVIAALHAVVYAAVQWFF